MERWGWAEDMNLELDVTPKMRKFGWTPLVISTYQIQQRDLVLRKKWMGVGVYFFGQVERLLERLQRVALTPMVKLCPGEE